MPLWPFRLYQCEGFSIGISILIVGISIRQPTN